MGRVIGFVPVRAGSKSIPGKNIKEINGKPLVFWSLEALNKCGLVDEVFVATDGNEIRSIVEGFGFEKVKVIGRSAETASDDASTESALLEFLEQREIDQDDIVVLVQATSPLLSAADLNNGIRMAQMSGGQTSIVSAVKDLRFYWRKDGIPINYDYRYRPRRQAFGGQYMENGAFYISKASAIRKSRCRISAPIEMCEMPEYSALELDEPLDWKIIESIMKEVRPLPRTVLSEIKLVLMDVDGVLTDAGMYYSESGDEVKKFNTRDGMGIELARSSGIECGIITSEHTGLVERRARKMGVKHLKQGARGKGKLMAAMEICNSENIELKNVAYIGDDLNCLELLCSVGFPACPSNAAAQIKSINGIKILNEVGGGGVVRELIELIVNAKGR